MCVFNIRIKTNGVGPYSAYHGVSLGLPDNTCFIRSTYVYAYNIAVCKVPGTVFTDGIFHPCTVVIYHPGAYLESREPRVRGVVTPSV